MIIIGWTDEENYHCRYLSSNAKNARYDEKEKSFSIKKKKKFISKGKKGKGK